MGLIDVASGASVWRGYDYYKENRVKLLFEKAPGIFTATVKGMSPEPYIVEIDVAHPRKSKCNCPYAEGKMIVCKHKVAVYFAAFPKEAQKFYDEMITYQEEEEKLEEELYDKVCEYVCKMKKSELQQALLELLFDGPEWQYDKFIQEHDLDDEYY